MTPTNQELRTLPPRIRQIVRESAENFLTTPELVMSGSHRKLVVSARHECIRVMTLRLKLNQSEIARYLGLHPSSVHYALIQAGWKEPPASLRWDPSAPDLSGVWAI